MARPIEVAIVGEAGNFLRELKKAESASAKFGRAAGVAGAAITGGLVVALKSSVGAAMDAQRVQARTESQLKALGFSYKKHANQIDKAVASTSKLAAIDDEELQGAFTRLLPATHNVGKALDQMRLAADVARARHVSLESATTLVTRANYGAATALKRLGISVPKVTTAVDELKESHKKYTVEQLRAAQETDRNAQAQKNLAELQKNFGGAAEAYGNSAAGAQERLGIAIENLQESMGALLLPMVTRVANAMSSLVGFFEEHKTLAKVLAIGFAALGAALLGVSVATKLANLAMLASPWGAVAIAIAAVVAGIIIAIKNWDDIKQAMSDVWDWVTGTFLGMWNDLKNAIKAVKDWVSDHWGEIATLISGPFALILGPATNAFGVRDKLKQAFTDVKNWAGDRIDDVVGFFTAMGTRIWNGFKEGWNNVKGNILNAFDGVKTHVGDVVGKVAGFWADLPGKVKDAVAGKAQALWDAVKGIFSKLPGFIKDALDIHSPSKEFENIGIAIMEGAIKGMKGLKDRLIEAAWDAFKAIPEKAAEAIAGAAAEISGTPLERMVSKASQIDYRKYPYVWGGGHNAQFAGPYDCSGAVSAVLHEGGFLNRPMVSGELAHFGQAGFGRYVTIFADAVHTFMSILGRGWGTSPENPGGGAGWLSYNTPYRSGFSIRHPVGLATGGIVTQPTFAMIGEAGPEAVIPLNKYGGVVNNYFSFPNYVGSKQELADLVQREFLRINRRNTTLGFT